MSWKDEGPDTISFSFGGIATTNRRTAHMPRTLSILPVTTHIEPRVRRSRESIAHILIQRTLQNPTGRPCDWRSQAKASSEGSRVRPPASFFPIFIKPQGLHRLRTSSRPRPFSHHPTRHRGVCSRARRVRVWLSPDGKRAGVVGQAGFGRTLLVGRLIGRSDDWRVWG